VGKEEVEDFTGASRRGYFVPAPARKMSGTAGMFVRPRNWEAFWILVLWKWHVPLAMG
jgi:hypothetical protein